MGYFKISHSKNRIPHIDRVLHETGEIVYNGTNEIYVNAAVHDGTRVADLMDILTSASVPEKNEFPQIERAIAGIKQGKEDNTMCDLVEEYAKEYAEDKVNKREKEMVVKMFEKKMSLDDVADCVTTLTKEELKEIQQEVIQKNKILALSR